MAASPFMREALAAARRVRGTTSPNPYVGAVLVRDGRVVATGATAPYGGPHAEAAAIAAAPDARGADLYVTLEPCFPFEGKRTRPCSEAIRDAGIRRVVVALEDPDARVAGRGIALLRHAGIEVEVGDGADEARDLLRPYIKHRQTGLPYVIAKFAASLDGRTATATGDSKWITGEAARDLGHQQRAWVDAIMVGSGTVLADDPSLTARPGGKLSERQPVRVILDARGRVPATARLFKEPGTTIVATSYTAPATWKGELTAAGALVLECEAGATGINLDQLLRTLAQRSIVSIWAEGGAALLGALFDARHVDEVWAFIAPVVIGGGGLPAVGGEGVLRVADAWRIADPIVESVGNDILVRGYTGDWSPGG
ncbi:MAG: bifunctional diaminohydroxyphosphoribosylaminopyrimidine deaminase/5-amino-6-(5-phosphoribosylamino)uracil reductase RibD [Dehalococcoidia bacterium]|nr:bifunctional diaminohydroxyphosphoribosylaminopyrimidine deaminase/5-amino-6-(5-phosphoribosylamino)uracil reductase RibD [Dehalococcoidia bacterium]